MSLSFLMPTNAMRVPGISCIGARIYLGKVSSFQVMPEDLLAGGVVETVEGAALAAIDAVERRTELDFGVRPDLVAGGAQSLEHLLAGSGVLPQCRSVRSCKSYSSNHPCPQHFFSSLNAIDVAASRVSSGNKRIGLLNARVHSSGRAIGKGTVPHKKGRLTAFGGGSCRTSVLRLSAN